MQSYLCRFGRSSETLLKQLSYLYCNFYTTVQFSYCAISTCVVGARLHVCIRAAECVNVLKFCPT